MKRGGIDAAAEIGVLKNGLLEGDRGLDAGDHVLAQGAAHLVHGFAAVFAEGDELADHGIVMPREWYSRRRHGYPPAHRGPPGW